MIDFAGSIFMKQICDNRDYKSTDIRDNRDRYFCANRENTRMDENTDDIRGWLAAELEKMGRGAKGRLANYLGIRPDGVTRMLNAEPGKEVRGIKADELVKMRRFFQSGTPDELQPISTPITSIKVTGKVAANSWMSVDDMDFGYDDEETVPSVSGYPTEWQFALKVDGNCLNKIASHGDRLVCLNVIKARIETKPGDLVIVERSRYDGQMVERTAKRLQQSATGKYELWPESNDPLHQEPIILEAAASGESVRVVGKVLWILRQP